MALAAWGCTTTVPPAPSPSEGLPSSPTLSSGAPPSAVPSASAAPTASAVASVSPAVGFHADTAIFSDDFSDADGVRWGAGDREQGRVAYADGELRVELTLAEKSLWSWRRLGDPWNVVRVTGRVTLGEGPGAAGWMCGSSPDDFVGAVMNNDREWVFIEIAAGRAGALDRGPLPSTLRDSTDHELTLECAGTATGALRMRMVVDDQEVATFERATGIATIDRVAVYADTTVPGFVASFDDAEASGGTQFGGFPGP